MNPNLSQFDEESITQGDHEIEALLNQHFSEMEDVAFGVLDDDLLHENLQDIRRRADELKVEHAKHKVAKCLREEARADAEMRLERIIGEVLEKLHATYVWLFLFDQKREELTAIIKPWKSLVVPLSQKSIVSRVAKTKEYFLSGDVGQLDFYLLQLSDVKSALSIPILTNRNELLGVLHFESPRVGAFSNTQVAEVQAATTELIAPLMLFKWLAVDRRKYVWSPYCDEWSVGKVTTKYLRSLTEALAGDEAPSPRFTVFYVDWPKETAWALASTRIGCFDKKMLPSDSNIGRVASSQIGEVIEIAPQGPDYEVPKTDCELGVKKVLRTRIPLPGESQEIGSYVLDISYYYEERPRLFSDSFVSELARDTGELLAEFQWQRRLLVNAHLESEICRNRPPLESNAHSAKQCLGVDECSIFVRDVRGRQLQVAATTGLEEPVERWLRKLCALQDEKVAVDPPTYRFSDPDDWGFTVFLGSGIGRAARKHDVLDTNEKGLPDGFPPQPTNKFREIGEAIYKTRRRFLGMSIDCGNGVLGVIRVLRAATREPFRRDDELLLQDIAKLCIRPLLDCRNEIQSAEVSNRRRSGRSHSLASAAFLRWPLTNSMTMPSSPVDQLLQEIVALFEPHQGIEACFYELHGGKTFSLCGRYAPIGTSKSPLVESASEVSVCEKSFAFKSLAERKAFSVYRAQDFDIFGLQKGARYPVTSQLILPVMTWAGPKLIKGVLMLASSNSIKWSSWHLRNVHLASQCLSAVFGPSADINPILFLCKVRTGLKAFAKFIAQEVGAEWAKLELWQGYGKKSVISSTYQRGRRKPDRSYWEWRGLTCEEAGAVDAERVLGMPVGETYDYGVEITTTWKACRMPLYLGPFEVGRVTWGPVSDVLLAEPEHFVGQIAGWWARFAQGMAAHWKWSFDRHMCDGAFSKWEESFHFDLGRRVPAERPESLPPFVVY